MKSTDNRQRAAKHNAQEEEEEEEDLVKRVRFCLVHLYADDTQLIYGFAPENACFALERINKDLADVWLWSSRNGHSLVLLLPVPYQVFLMLAIIMASCALSSASLKSCFAPRIPVHSLRFLNHEACLLPTPLRPFILHIIS